VAQLPSYVQDEHDGDEARTEVLRAATVQQPERKTAANGSKATYACVMKSAVL
jgi:hypothetical protein